MEFYTNIFREKNTLFVRGYDRYGKREDKIVRYKPHLFLPSPKPTKYKSLAGANIDKKMFESMSEARKFIDQYKDVSNFSVYGFDRWEFAYLAENFKKIIPSLKKISIGYMDIEVHSEEGFPHADKAEHEVSVITLIKKEKIYVLSSKPFDKTKIKNNKDLAHIDPDRILFFLCNNERDLLQKFVRLWEKLDFDIITGWNIAGFDILYLVNRITNIFDREFASRLSPYRKIRNKEVKSRYGNYRKEADIMGISTLDYYDLYQKFDPKQKESFTLDYIAFYELEKRKVDYKELGYADLPDLWNRNPQLYIEYNIQDTLLVQDIEHKLRFLELAVSIAYDAKVRFIDSIKSVALWEAIVYNHLRDKNVYFPISQLKFDKRQSNNELEENETDEESIIGAYVKPPIKKLFKWVVSFDFSSLYPHIIMMWNISPETLLGYVKDNKTIDDLLNNNFFDTRDIVTANGCRYRNDIVGVFPELMRIQFNLRKHYKDQMLHLKKIDGDKNEIQGLDTFQQATKIKINSLFGVTANESFLFFNKENAEAITLTGQLAVRWAYTKINNFLNYYLGTKDLDFCAYADTDSNYLNLGPIVERTGLTDTHEIVDYLNKFCEEVLTPEINRIFGELAKKMNCSENMLNMKRESVAEYGIWRAKKNYALYVWDDEGKRYTEPKIKIVGMEAVKSNVPEPCRKALKEAIKILFEGSEEDCQKYIKKFREEFQKLPVENIARPTSVSDVKSFIGPNGYIKGTPIGAKVAILYNKFIKDKKLENKYTLASDGTKMKYVKLVKFNPIQDQSFGAPDGKFPTEFQIEKYVDRDYQFEKTFLGPFRSLLTVAGYDEEKKATLEDFFNG